MTLEMTPEPGDNRGIGTVGNGSQQVAYRRREGDTLTGEDARQDRLAWAKGVSDRYSISEDGEMADMERSLGESAREYRRIMASMFEKEGYVKGMAMKALYAMGLTTPEKYFEKKRARAEVLAKKYGKMRSKIDVLKKDRIGTFLEIEREIDELSRCREIYQEEGERIEGEIDDLREVLGEAMRNGGSYNDKTATQLREEIYRAQELRAEYRDRYEDAELRLKDASRRRGMAIGAIKKLSSLRTMASERKVAVYEGGLIAAEDCTDLADVAGDIGELERQGAPLFEELGEHSARMNNAGEVLWNGLYTGLAVKDQEVAEEENGKSEEIELKVKGRREQRREAVDRFLQEREGSIETIF